jgi:hypothetical protein
MVGPEATVNPAANRFPLWVALREIKHRKCQRTRQ